VSGDADLTLYDPRAVADLLGSLDPNRTVEIEIGCGNGHFLCSYAQARPETLLLGVEVKKNAARNRPERSPSAG